MLQTKRSKNLSQIKLFLIVPLLFAFVFTFNTKTVAQKNVKNEVISYTITKDTKNFNKLAQEISQQSTLLEFSNIRRNDENEITHINISNKGESPGMNFSNNSTNPIHPITIEITDENKVQFTSTNSISVNTDSNTVNDKNTAIRVIGYGQNTKNENNNFQANTEKPKQQQIVVRGYPVNTLTEPLIIIDGLISSKKFEDLNPDDIFSMNVLKDPSVVVKYGDKAKDGVLEVTTKKHKNTFTISHSGKEPLLVIDGKISSKNINDIEPDLIESMSVIKGQKAIDKYGEKGKEGVVEITLKKN